MKSVINHLENVDQYVVESCQPDLTPFNKAVIV